MNPWILRALDLAAALVAGAGLVLILAAALARRPSFADRVAQGRVQERPPSALVAWARRVSTSALDSLGSTSESVARRLSLAGMNPDVSVFRLRQAVAGVVGLVAACALVAARHASSLRGIPHSPVRLRARRHPPWSRRHGPIPHRARECPPARD